MPNDLLSRIDRLTSENLVSETFAYILRENAYAPYQRLFYSYLFDVNHCPSTQEISFKIDTQPNFGKFGIPDIIIHGQDRVVVIENKFYAPFSGEHQLSGYCRLLQHDEELSKKKDRWLVLLTTSGRLSYYKKELVKDFASVFPGIVDIDSMSARILDSGIKFKIIEWQEIIKRFESDDLLVSSLVSYINKNYVGEVVFMAAELEVLKSKTYAEALDKLFKRIDHLRERIHSETYDTKITRMSQSYNFYGFTIKMQRMSAFFGYMRPLWLDLEPYTPLYLQVRLEWITDNKVDRVKLSQKLEEKFKLNQEYGYVKAYPVPSLENADALAEALTEDLGFLDDDCQSSI